MESFSWQAFYAGDLQQVYALVVVPALLLVIVLVAGSSRDAAFADARFLRLYIVTFCVETIVDPIATGPITHALGLGETASTGVMLAFVLIGDFRVFLLVSYLTRSERSLRTAALEAGLWTLVVPVFTGISLASLKFVVPELPEQVMWLTYELAFVVVVLVLRRRVVPIRLTDENGDLARRLQAVVGYVGCYYALWATSDALTLFGGLDVSWLLRIVPNQLYYGFYLPWVAFVFFWRR